MFKNIKTYDKSKKANRNICKGWGIGAVLALSTILPIDALAHNGFLNFCDGAIKCGTGGAGAADSSSGMDSMTNPALTAKQDNNWIVSLGWFRPVINVDTSAAPLGNPVGKQTSKLKDLPDFAAGFTYHFRDNLTFGIAANAAGIGTKYNSSLMGRVALASPKIHTELMYRLFHITPSISSKISDTVSLGAALIIGYADLKTNMATGNLSMTKGNNKRQARIGFGGRIGATWDASELVSFGASIATPVWFKKFTRYSDVAQTSLNTPMNYVIGSAWHVTTSTDLLLDFKQIFFNKVKLIKRTPEEGGFGWRDQKIVMLGVKQRYNLITASLGYNLANSPIKKTSTFVNGLTPAIGTGHITAGLGYKFSDSTELLANGYYAPKRTQTDPGTGDKFSQFGKGTKISLRQYGLAMGVKCNF